MIILLYVVACALCVWVIESCWLYYNTRKIALDNLNVINLTMAPSKAKDAQIQRQLDFLKVQSIFNPFVNAPRIDIS